ncbi:UBC6 [Symbiodinium sp. CCMP2592]|nr:UBC6 [Symbiodinium sp. CCMP2592]
MMQQFAAVKAIIGTLQDDTARQHVLTAQLHSLEQQLKAMDLGNEDMEPLMKTIADSPFSPGQKDQLITIVSEKIAKAAASKRTKKCTQELPDVAPFLSEDDVSCLSNPDLNVLAKVTRLSMVFSRVGCSNPTEQSCGRAISFLKQHMQVAELGEPGEFLKSVQDFKAALKGHVKKMLPASVHVQTFSTPDQLPKDLAERCFKDSPQASVRSGPVGITGPVRKSHKSVSPSTSASSWQHQPGMFPSHMLPSHVPLLPSHGQQFMTMQQMMQAYNHMQQQWMAPPTPKSQGLPNLVLFNQPGQPAGHQSQGKPTDAQIVPSNQAGQGHRSEPQGHQSDPHGQQQQIENWGLQSETTNDQNKPPLQPAEQANAMLAAWESRKLESDKGPAMKKPSAADAATASSSKAPLAMLGRKAYVSQHGIESVLTDLKKSGLLADDVTSSRSSIKRAREEDLASLTGVYGPLVQKMEVPVEGQCNKTVTVPYIHPAAFLKHIFSLAPLWEFLRQEVLPHKETPSYARPWGLIFYADEALWFPLTCLRSHHCSSIGGLTCLWRLMLRLFFTDHDMRKGMVVDTPEGDHFPIFLDLKILVADEAAIKQSIEGKGASGTVFCCRCSNVVAARSTVSDMRSEFVSSLCTDYSKFRLHTNATTRDFLAFLDAQHGTVSKAQFEALETALGFNLRVHGLLMDDIIGHKVPEAIMFDFFHIYLVHGIVGNELGCFFAELRDAGFGEDRLMDFVSSFRWPKQFASPDAKRVFAKREKKTSPVKAEASELLNALPVLRIFILKFVMTTAISPGTVQACMCFLMLCKVVDMLHDAVRGRAVDPAVLHDTIVKHSNCLLETYGQDIWVPKNHMSLHLGEFLAKFGHLVWCFTHERKHKVVKRFANQKLDGSRGFEESVLKDVLAVQLNCISAELPSSKVRLMNPKPAPKKLVDLVGQVMPFATGPILHDLRAMHAGGFVCTKGDIVAVDATTVGLVQFHFQAAGQVWTCVTPWKHVYEHMFECTDLDPFITTTDSIKSCCIYSEKDGKAIVLV